MMTYKIIRLIHLALYFIVAVQLTFYVYLMSDALKQISISSFIEQRKVVHPLMSARHQWLYYAVLILSLVMVLWSFRTETKWTFVSFLIAFFCVVADVLIAVRGNGPINSLIQATPMSASNIDWELLRERWLEFINLRGVIIMAGMLSLFVGLVFRR